MEARATHKYIGSSPRKMRLVIDLIRGMAADKAIEVLHFHSKHASKPAEKVLRSAIANLLNKNEDSGRIDPSEMYVKEAYVNQGPSLRRILPAPMGRAYRIKKRSNHLTIVVSTKE
ncbi:MAG: 50S ribosomal protein L22 [Bacteroidota bacterium]